MKQRFSVIPLVSVDLNSSNLLAGRNNYPPCSPTYETNDLFNRAKYGLDEEQNYTMTNGNMTVTSAASVSKGDIELLENKISVLEKQISKIKNKHVKVLSDCSATQISRASHPMPTADANHEFNVVLNK